MRPHHLSHADPGAGRRSRHQRAQDTGEAGTRGGVAAEEQDDAKDFPASLVGSKCLGWFSWLPEGRDRL